MGGIANNKCKCLDRSNTMDLLRCQAAIVIEKSENGQALADPELLSRVLLAKRINLYQELLILIFIGRANQFVQTTLQLNLQKKSIFIENRADHQVCKNIFAEETNLKQLLFKLLCR